MKSSRLILLLVLAWATLVDDTLAFPTPGDGSVWKQRRRSTSWFHMMPHYECTTATVMSALGDMMAQLKQHRQASATSATDTAMVPDATSSTSTTVTAKNDDAAASLTTQSSPTFNINWQRTRQFMIKGFGEGFLWTLWYRFAEQWTRSLTSALFVSSSYLGQRVFLRTLISTMIALVLDLTLACPFIYGFWDIPLPALLRGTPWRDIPMEVKHKLGHMLLASVEVWTPVNVLIYNVPVQYRAYIMSVTDVFWQSIVSSITSSSTTTSVESNSSISLTENEAAA